MVIPLYLYWFRKSIVVVPSSISINKKGVTSGRRQGACIIEHSFGGSGFAGVDVGDDADVSDLVEFVGGFGGEGGGIFAFVESGLSLESDFFPDGRVPGESSECFNHQEYIYKSILKSNPITSQIMKRIRKSLDLVFLSCSRIPFCAISGTCMHSTSACYLKIASPSSRTRSRTSPDPTPCAAICSPSPCALALSSSSAGSSSASPRTSPSPYPHIIRLYNKRYTISWTGTLIFFEDLRKSISSSHRIVF